ncbi:MAG: cytochrome c3 family protein [Anaerolineales bacterium]|nr:cytochrome c3 family protein [Anaerolineales bacterium]
MSIKRLLFLIGGLLLLATVVVACGSGATEEMTGGQVAAPAAEPPFLAAWAGSAHADASAEAFVHWDGDDPAVIPADCARCHSPAGYVDFLGGDGSAAGMVDADVAAPGGVISCTTCHNDATQTLSSVTFPSGVTVTGLGPEARCMVCHQGRESGGSVAEATAGMAPDTVSADLSFLNIHYFAAAATLYGGQARGGYQYEGMSYDSRYEHVEGVSTCVDCHDSHTLEIQLETCSFCHEVDTVEALRDVREPSSTVDYDGDGNLTEGMYYEIQGMQAALLAGIQAYAVEIAGTAVAYSPDAYPYFFIDTNANGILDEDEATVPNRFTAWTPRLLAAAYNYQLSVKDPGAFAHGNKYIIQLLFDSLADLNTQLSNPIDMSAMRRQDAGHFAGNTEPFRHWDGDPDFGTVPNGCVRCHTATGLPMFLANAGSTIAQPASNGFQCSTCHDETNWPNRYTVDSVSMPSGLSVTFGEGADSNLCITCHQGRESMASVNRVIGSTPADEVSASIRFRNIHYFAAGATLFGDEAQGMYQFAGNAYFGQNDHPASMGGNLNTCLSCHDAHSLEIALSTCATCHTGISDVREIRMTANAIDYDGDGDAAEPLDQEIATMADLLYLAIQDYAADTLSTPIAYSPTAYPYFFADANANGLVDEGEGGYSTWSPRLLIAAYNYQYFQKDPGAFAHNGRYVIQVLYDTLVYMNVDVSAMTRP